QRGGLAAGAGRGLRGPMGFEFAAARRMDSSRSRPEDMEEAQLGRGFDLAGDIHAANALVDRIAALGVDGEMRVLTGPASRTTALLRADASDMRESDNAVPDG